ncbi:MAG: SEL1-like repeat protein [Rhodospirillales bacterium]|nr:SEL1-like repeat protein [Rhodospirillales bacterium]MCB9965209.1 SEL1-like repeat protein [Rhodospirillales bacterium]MCB9973228.1 SEL1-like repeat protein [Rhodospirillales bacterium]MCB9979511.1 SEL1-like repeat protein [Rhodospirillales bacterium]
MTKAFHDDRGAAERSMLYARPKDDTENTPREKPVLKVDAKKVVPVRKTAAPNRETQIIKLLEQIRNRLEDIEKERGELWETLQDQSKTLNKIEDRSTSTEKTFLSLENRLSRTELSEAPLIERLDEIERAQKARDEERGDHSDLKREILDRIEESDLQTARLIERIDEAMSMQTRMTRRIDKMVQDKQRLSRKMALLEENMEATRNALASKAMVLLGDRNLLGNGAVSTPPIPIFSRSMEDEDDFDPRDGLNDNHDTPPPHRDSALSRAPDMPPSSHAAAPRLDRNPIRTQVFAAIVFFMVAIGIGWFISQAIPTHTPIYQAGTIEKFAPAEGYRTTAGRASSSYPAGRFSGLEDEQTLAERLNDIQPATGYGKTAGLTPQDSPPSSQTTPKTEETTYTPQTAAIPDASTTITAAATKANEAYAPDPSLPDSFKKLEQDAINGSAEAQHDLAALYTAGHGGVKQDYVRAAHWFEEASAKGIANAAYNLGVLYHQGMGVNQDLNKALDWYRKAADLGHPEAQYNLGIAYIEGIGVDYDPSKAADYFESAAASGITEAAFNLGLIYENGLMGKAQPEDALLWYKTAADQGNKDARAALEHLSKTLHIDPSEIESLVEKIQTPAIEPQSSMTAEKTLNSRQKWAKESGLVAQIQDALMSYGLYPGPIDGDNGPLTADAIRLYQARNDIPVTGTPSEELLVHMLSKNLKNRAYQELGSGE